MFCDAQNTCLNSKHVFKQRDKNYIKILHKQISLTGPMKYITNHLDCIKLVENIHGHKRCQAITLNSSLHCVLA